MFFSATVAFLKLLSDLSVAQLQGLTECAFALIRKVNSEMGEFDAESGVFVCVWHTPDVLWHTRDSRLAH
jgi:hypothetical protein